MIFSAAIFGLTIENKIAASENVSEQIAQADTGEVKSAESEESEPKPEPVETREPISEYEVPILMYHYIRDYNNPEDKIGTNLSVSVENFKNQLQYLADNNYQTVNLDYITEPYKTDFKPIIITFDDGYEDMFTNAYPVLQEHNYFGVFYLITEFVGRTNYLSWDMVFEMKDNQMQFASHTLNHPDLTQLGESDIIKQVTESKQVLAEKIGQEINHFCYPTGKYNQTVIDKLKEAGYTTATTTKSGLANHDSDPFELRRIRMTDQTNLKATLQD